MATKVILPKQGLQMTEGTIIAWLVKEGGACTEGEPLFEMETDKLTITMDSPASGELLKIVRGEGETVPITELIAVIGEHGEDISSILSEAGGSAAPSAAAPAEQAAAPAASSAPAAAAVSGGKVFASPRAKMRADERGIDIAQIGGTGPEGLVVERDVAAFDVTKATPLAKKIAANEGVSLSDISGTGSHGKITKDDVLSVSRPAAMAAQRGEKLVPFSGMRKIIAQRMKESQNTNAQTTHTIRVDMTNAGALREAFKKADKKVSYNDVIIKATCRALSEEPMMNARFTDKGIVVMDYVNLGVAVAIDGGLIVPNIKDADLMSLEEISVSAKALADKAKTGKLQPDEYAGGTFTISNLGMFGLDSFVAIINPPEAGILAVGKIEKAAVVVDDQIVIRPMMCLTLSYDHRVIDGAPAAQFLAKIKQYLENPYLML